MDNLERRVITCDVELRGGGDAEPTTIRGHAAVFNRLSENLGGFREQVTPGAFARAIEEDDVRALFNHDPNFVLGRNKAGTLELSEDRTGLLSIIDPPDTAVGRDVLTSIERGDVTGMSFSFVTITDEWEHSEEDKEPSTRTLKEVRLFDVGPVTFPAYPQTDVGVRVAMRSLERAKQSVLAAHAARRRHLHIMGLMSRA